MANKFNKFQKMLDKKSGFVFYVSTCKLAVYLNTLNSSGVTQSEKIFDRFYKKREK